MNLHEYQAKRLLAEAGVTVPRGIPAFSLKEAINQARELGGPRWVVKAQVHAGGRGKAGGVRVVDSIAAVEQAAQALLGKPLVTAQTGPEGQHVAALLIEEPSVLLREFYLALVVDRASARMRFVASDRGGVEIEELAREQPQAIASITIDPRVGFLPYQGRQLGFAWGLEPAAVQQLVRTMQAMARLAPQLDALMIEINPLALTAEGRLLALDAKISMDDNALYRHPESDELFDSTQQDGREITARQFGLNYISLGGNIGCMVNGAGLAMATMDLIKLHGGEPANFLDVGGGAAADKVTQAFKLILSDQRVRAILVNIFGGITRCDLLAQGILQAAREVGIHLPVVVRLEGTNREEGLALLRESGLALITAEGLDDAAAKAVAAAAG
ncbi:MULTISPECIES: ADP-forming succinate--CoA ligase subunit beta [Acidithiobacillus]|uniref:Succinate--CoA ligase [ADP-forming] subunit beta n=4 Tax=Acidithiobacillus caldus TaxID=33059 RepID=F9ZRS2_ACICS|nr:MULTISPECIES: ADP-forming succinate--CoA ligase subunit beta [Acidithiobacillus]AEK59087.1 Succinyl-CoA ligase ADP-forming beta chain [Acidithiobacillus caldus SM-1]AIA56131.1 Succinyl-CoA ligase (ADP-forming) beta chain [Acidithiobacillus caldus ATCC 51756]AUW33480.1 ADP-forming succinate--CoA ligase subunit beta [Acidithiobacillus caldus]MBU2730356.1 ADP-forming succinate--CoA ligase subunit beta [Acidithiobacillus caldus]MBU2735494.1 ADP-forming succinate--CoA ligase subunit beta [Acidit